MNILTLLQQRIHDALRNLTADPAPYAAMIKPTQDAKHGDYQANCAMSLGKALGKTPRVVAQEIVDRLDAGDLLDKPEVAGPGFINVRLKNSWLAERLRAIARDDRLGVDKVRQPRTYVVDFSGPNVAKPMHVGHLRSTIIGDTLIRQLRFLGNKVIGDNHLGDWGTQFGIILYGYKNLRDDKAFQADPVRELARLYVEVRSRMKGDEDDEKADDPIADACRLETARLHAGDEENLRLWKLFQPYCQDEINRIYGRLDIHFDCTLGESFYQPMLAGVVDELLAKGVAQISQDAVVISFGEDQPPSLIRKKDGAFTYTTTDLATIKYRAEHFHANVLLYVVDFRQALHFKNLFDAARRWGCGNAEMMHISFGSVLGKDGKPLRTRPDSGQARPIAKPKNVELGELLDEAVRRAGLVYEAGVKEAHERGEEVIDLSDDEKRQVCEAIGVGAVKYADLCQNRNSDYKFDFDKMLAMTGNTATYMQYAYVRNRGIFRKGSIDPERLRTEPPAVLLETPYERALAIQLLRLKEALTAAAAEYQPNLITGYLWDLAKTYSGFFQNCPVLKAPSSELRDSRLLLCDLTARVLRLCLELLGIRCVERM